MNKIIKNALALTLITVVLGGILGIVHYITLKPIAVQEQKTKEAAYAAVFPDGVSFSDMDMTEDDMEGTCAQAVADAGLTQETIDGIASVYDGADGAGNLLGYVFTITTSEGYGGDIQFTLGISLDGTMNGISFLSISETAGLGMRATKDDFKQQFVGMSAAQSIEYTKSGKTADNQIDALSGATITSNAVTNGVNAGIAAFHAITEGGQS